MAGTLAQHYLAASVTTASPRRLLVMLYDRLVFDLDRATEYQQAGDQAAASEQIRHAQQIVAELRSSLRVELWDGADNLAALYGFVLGELIAVHGTPDPTRLRKVTDIVSGLRDAWRAAVESLPGAEGSGRVAAPVLVPVGVMSAPAAVSAVSQQLSWVG